MAEKCNHGIARMERKRDIFHEISFLRNRLAKAEKAAEKEYLYDSDEIAHTDEVLCISGQRKLSMVFRSHYLVNSVATGICARIII